MSHLDSSLAIVYDVLLVAVAVGNHMDLKFLLLHLFIFFQAVEQDYRSPVLVSWIEPWVGQYF